MSARSHATRRDERLLSGTRGDNESILELTDIQNPEALKDNPLEVELDIDLAKGEMILPTAGRYELDLRVDIDPRGVNSPVMDRVSADIYRVYLFSWMGR